jgi:hypothetical protein
MLDWRLLSLLLTFPAFYAWADDTIRLEERFPAGYQYHVSSRVDLSGNLNLPPMMKDAKPGTIAITGSASVEYDERIVDGEQAGKPPEKTIRVYSRLDFKRKLGEQTQESSLRPEVRRMVLMRLVQSEVPFSPDGPLLWSEIDRVRTDVFAPALRGLLPDKAVKIGDQWTASSAAAQELTDLDKINGGQVGCKLQDVLVRDGRRVARVRLSGVLNGLNEDGPNRQQLEGFFLFDLDARFISYVYLDATSWLLDKDDKPQGRVDGRFTLTRRLGASPDLGDASVRALTTEPNDDNTLLLFREKGLGVEFTYPRRWTVRQADARQIVLDEPSGGGLAITLEPLSQTPTGQELLDEAKKTLGQRSVRINRQSTVDRQNTLGAALEHFKIEAEIDKEMWLLDYTVSRQSVGGATFMARWPTKSGADLAKDVERIARSLKLVPPKK